MKNRGTILILRFGGVPFTQNIHTKFEANLYIGLREVKYITLYQLDLNKVEKSYYSACMRKISSKYVQQFESQKCV